MHGIQETESMYIGLNLFTTQPLEECVNHGHEAALDAGHLLLVLKLLDARASCVRINTLTANQVPLLLPHAGVDVDILDCNPQRAMLRNVDPTVNLPAQVQGDEERRRHVSFEKGLGVRRSATDWEKCDIELGDEGKGTNAEGYPRAPDTKCGLVREFVEGVTVRLPEYIVSAGTSVRTGLCDLPGHAEADVRNTNTAEDEQNCDTRQGQEPSEDISATGSEIDVCQQSEQKLDDHHNDWTTLLIDIGGDFRAHT
jgi:hypothetical protein